MTKTQLPEIPKKIEAKMLSFPEIRLESQHVTDWGYKYFVYFRQSEQLVAQFKDLDSLEKFLDDMLMADPENRNFVRKGRGFKIA